MAEPVRSFASGTATLEAALRVAGVGPGDEVITSPITWVATANVIVGTGARPVFVDVDPATRNLDLGAVEAAITPRTRAVLPVYLSGLPVDLDSLYQIARRHGLRVIEDAAQAIDARWRGARIGSVGDLVSFSFQANKNITCGEGGCLVVNSHDEALQAERFRLQGVIRTGDDGMDVEHPGTKANLTDICATIGLGQLAHLSRITERRARLAEAYFDAAARYDLEGLGIELPLPLDPTVATTNWHMFQVVLPTDRLIGGRAAIMRAMRAVGIDTGVHYPAVHLFTFYRGARLARGHAPCGRARRQRHPDLAAIPGDVNRRCRSRVRRPSKVLQGPLVLRDVTISIVVPVYDEEEVLELLFDRLYPGPGRFRRALRSHLRR